MKFKKSKLIILGIIAALMTVSAYACGLATPWEEGKYITDIVALVLIKAQP